MATIGIDLGGTNIAVGVVDEQGNILGRATAKTRAQRPVSEIIRDMAATARQAVENAGLSMDDIEAVGVAAPGSVNPETGVIEYANNIGFQNTPVGPELQKLLNIPVTLGNDANLAAYGELMAGAGKEVDTMIAVTLGTGVGGGIIIDRKIYTGFNFVGAELGHLIIVENGEQCTCGTRGCWEAYASASALIRQTKAAMKQHPDSKMWELCGGSEDNASGRTAFDAMRAGDAAGRDVVDRYIDHIATGIISIINIFQPELICIGGGICNEGETLMAPLREKVFGSVYNRSSDKSRQTRLVRASLGNDAGIIGAAMVGKL